MLKEILIFLHVQLTLFSICSMKESPFEDNGLYNFCYMERLNKTIPTNVKSKILVWLLKPGTVKSERILLEQIESLRSRAHFNSRKKILIIIHGFVERYKLISPTMDIAKAYSLRGDYNVLAIDVHKIIGYFYIRSVKSIYKVATVLAKAISSLLKAANMKVSDVNMLGFSLGAQISGLTGKTYTKLFGGKINRITAIDPAGPCFRSVKPKYRLNKDDADFVEVVHTGSKAFGTSLPLGHVDYYLNGGHYSNQLPNTIIISHLSACYLWMKTFVLEPVVAKRCNNMKEVESLTCEGEEVLLKPETSTKRRGLYLIDKTSLTLDDYFKIKMACRLNKCNMHT